MAESSAAEYEQIMSDYTALWNGEFSNLDVVAESVDLVHPSAPDGELHGREALDGFIRKYHSAFPDFHITVHDWIARDGVVMKEYTMTGTHEGEFKGVPPTGRAVESPGMGKILIADGQVQEDRLYFNQLAALEQLGLSVE